MVDHCSRLTWATKGGSLLQFLQFKKEKQMRENVFKTGGKMGSSFYRALRRFLDFLARTFGMFLHHLGLKRLNLVEFQDFQAPWTSISLS